MPFGSSTSQITGAEILFRMSSNAVLNAVQLFRTESLTGAGLPSHSERSMLQGLNRANELSSLAREPSAGHLEFCELAMIWAVSS